MDDRPGARRPSGRTRVAAAVALLLALAQCAAPLQIRPATPVALRFAPDPALQRLIDPRPAGDGLAWLGGDAASSAPVGDERWIWIFGDTLLGSVRDRCPNGRAYCGRMIDDSPGGMIANSVGVMTRRADGSMAPLATYWRTTRDGPAPIFAAAAPGELLWPLALVHLRGVLLVAASRHARATGLHSLGSLILRIDDPDLPPDQWTYTRHPLPDAVVGSATRAPLTWTTALVPAGDFLYVFGKWGTGTEPRTVLARLPLDEIDDPDWRPAPRYLLGSDDGGEEWGAFDPARLRALPGLPGTSEATIHYDDVLGWHTFQIPWPAFEVRLYTAARLTGPWRDRGIVYRIPAPWRTAVVEPCDPPACEQRYLAYAVKSHPELAPPGGYALSYNVNLLAGTRATAERAAEEVHGFYVPRMISAPGLDRPPG